MSETLAEAVGTLMLLMRLFRISGKHYWRVIKHVSTMGMAHAKLKFKALFLTGALRDYTGRLGVVNPFTAMRNT